VTFTKTRSPELAENVKYAESPPPKLADAAVPSVATEP
jgi:hypothetical protein